MELNILFWGLTIGLAGKILLALGVLIVHAKLVKEHRIDRQVIRSFRMEFMITMLGILLIIAGYLLEIYFYHAADLLSCTGTVCAGALDALLAR